MAKKPVKSRRIGSTPAALPREPWTRPERIAPLKKRFGTSFLDDFVRGHSAGDVFREIVQNEYDGQGKTIEILFGPAELNITGSGRPIGAEGWKRLSVIAGTGPVVGDQSGDIVEAKANGIGSKNFGIRSLFYFGDEVNIRSNGRAALLDFSELGTDNYSDPSSRGRAGVSIHVPYRQSETRRVEPFTPEREARAMEEIRSALLPTLVKLADAGKKTGIQGLTAISSRTDRKLLWRQSAKAEVCKLRGVTALRRSGQLREWRAGEDEPALTRVDEIEFSRPVAVPAEHQSLDFPAYYRTGSQALRIAVSLPLVRNRIDLSQSGHFFYPLQAPQGRTGMVASISAPFQMDNDRSSLLDTSWNSWLAEQAAELAQDLLVGDWFERFGADAYLALGNTGLATPTHARDVIEAHFKSAECWPTREVIGKARTFAKAEDIVLPEEAALDDFMGDRRYFDPRMIQNGRVVELARAAGAKTFGVPSLVMLRCDSPDIKLTTDVATTQARFVYTPYEPKLLDVGIQVRSAEALTKLSARLTAAHRTDLGSTPSTLTADGRLAPANTLIKVDELNWDDCPEPLANRLDRRLNHARAVAKHCKPFNLSRWVEDACARAAVGESEERERHAVYRWLTQPDVKMTPRLLATIRRSPIVKDHRGDWVSPVELCLPPPREISDLSSVLHLPSKDLAKRTNLLNRLKIRRKIAASDLVALARLVASDPTLAPTLERLLLRHSRLLRVSDFKALSTIPCLLARSGDIAAPRDLHLAAPNNIEWLADDRLIVAGSTRELHRQLGCRTEPKALTLLAVLTSRREEEAAPPRPEEFYTALVEAFRRDGLPVAPYADHPILFINGGYHAPEDALTWTLSSRILAGAIPVFRGSDAAAKAYEALGAHSRPQPAHWITFFKWLNARAVTTGGRLAPNDRVLARAAYKQLAWTQVDWPDDLKILLGVSGALHSLNDVTAQRLLDNDYPALAKALVDKGAPLDFTDASDDARAFLQKFSIRRLTTVSGTATVTTGKLASPQPWLTKARDERLVLIRRPDFAIALAELAHAQRRLDPGFNPATRSRIAERLGGMTRIDVVQDIQLAYTLADRTVAVPADADLSDDRIAIIPPRSHVEFDQIFSITLAEIAGAKTLQDVRTLSLSIASLLRCRSIADVRSFLTRQGIPLPPAFRGEDDGGLDDLFSTDDRVEEAIRGVLGTLNTTPNTTPAVPSPAPVTTPVPAPPVPPAPPTPPPPLPNIAKVKLTIAEPTQDAPPPSSPSPGGGGGGGGWSPPTPQDVMRDRQVGDRGEELIYLAELERVRSLGHERPEELVIWTSRTQPGADHDIRSIDEAGQILWIEVKATTGMDGRFDWSRGEFEKAMREGKQYELVRVYQANSANPIAKRFRNPAALQGGRLRIELNSLRAYVQSGG